METKEKLKTLKEMDKGGCHYCVDIVRKVSISKLKAEAIKWVRKWKLEIEIIRRSKDTKYLINHRNSDKIKYQNRIIAFYDFFNLTEEDLQ